MRPVPETTAALAELGTFDFQNQALSVRLRQVGQDVAALVPECVGLSLTLRELEVTFTLVAGELDTAVLDAVQYLDGGPCVEAILSGTPVTTSDDVLDEHRWRLFSAARATKGVASTLSLPIVDASGGAADGLVIGGFNLYGATSTCFDEHHDQLARILGAWAGGATTNADLSFGTREIARRAPAVLQRALDLARVSALLAEKHGGDHARWEDRIRSAAVRAGIPLATLVDQLEQMLR